MIYRILNRFGKTVIGIGAMMFFFNTDLGLNIFLFGVGLDVVSEVNKDILVSLSDSVDVSTRWALRKLKKK